MNRSPHITVVGSVNLDFVARGARLPAPGETVTGATLARHPGGKGANQALAARRLGAEVRLVARVGRDTLAAEALQLLRAGGVDLAGCREDAQAATGVALIAVSAEGENQIVVAPGANARLRPAHLDNCAAFYAEREAAAWRDTRVPCWLVTDVEAKARMQKNGVAVFVAQRLTAGIVNDWRDAELHYKKLRVAGNPRAWFC